MEFFHIVFGKQLLHWLNTSILDYKYSVDWLPAADVALLVEFVAVAFEAVVAFEAAVAFAAGVVEFATGIVIFIPAISFWANTTIRQ